VTLVIWQFASRVTRAAELHGHVIVLTATIPKVDKRSNNEMPRISLIVLLIYVRNDRQNAITAHRKLSEVLYRNVVFILVGATIYSCGRNIPRAATDKSSEFLDCSDIFRALNKTIVFQLPSEAIPLCS
jgi:hypothetical protein